MRPRCENCGHDKLRAFSCKRRGFCPSFGARRMSQTAAQLTDHVFHRLPVGQWVLSVPKRLRIFLRVIAQTLQDHCPGAAQVHTTDDQCAVGKCA